MTNGELSLSERADEMEADYGELLAEESDGSGGCMEIAEALSELRDE